MAALSALAALTASNRVWESVRIALSGAGPAAQAQFKGLKSWLANSKGNLDLRFTPLTAEGVTTADDGLGVGAGATKIYGVYLKKRASGTASYISFVDNGTDDNYYGGSLTGAVRLQIAANAANQEHVYVTPQGVAMANGIRVVSTTAAAAGTTAGTAANSVDGFLITGA